MWSIKIYWKSTKRDNVKEKYRNNKTNNKTQATNYRNNGGDKMKNYWKQMKEDNRGIGVVEIILILVILIALVIIFRDQITSLVTKILDKITTNADNIINTTVTPNP